MTAGEITVVGTVGVLTAFGQVCWVRQERWLLLYGALDELGSVGQQAAAELEYDPTTPV